MRTLARQYYRYGRSRVATLLKHPGSLHVRQAAPAMVAPVAVAAAAGPGPLRRLGRVLTLAYLGAITVLAGRDRALRPRERIRLGVAALVMHGAWSAGFWVGLVRRPRRERSPVDVLVVGSSLPPGGIATAIEMQLEAFREAAIGAEMEDLGRALRDRPGAVSAVNVGAVVRDALAVARRVRSTRPQLVALHVTAWPTLPLLRALALAGAARLAGARPIVHLHGDIERGLSGASGGAYRPVMRALGRLASFVVLTPTLAERLGEIAQSVAVVPNGVDTDRFRPAPDPPGAPTVVFVGALGPSKGVDDLLAVADDLPDAARVLVVGSTGPDGAGAARAVEDRAAQLPPGRVELVGLVGHEALPETLRRGSVFVLPSRAEGLSLALLEAMSSGLACVVTDVGESGRVVREAGAGIVVRPGDREGLRNALVHLLEDHELVSRLGRAARTAAVERWSIGAYRDRLAQAYAPELEAPR
jgi:glycosyltransferase involved in cell wall biosynthesis